MAEIMQLVSAVILAVAASVTVVLAARLVRIVERFERRLSAAARAQKPGQADDPPL